MELHVSTRKKVEMSNFGPWKRNETIIIIILITKAKYIDHLQINVKTNCAHKAAYFLMMLTLLLKTYMYEPVREKTNNLHGRKQRRRSASR